MGRLWLMVLFVAGLWCDQMALWTFWKQLTDLGRAMEIPEFQFGNQICIGVTKIHINRSGIIKRRRCSVDSGPQTHGLGVTHWKQSVFFYSLGSLNNLGKLERNQSLELHGAPVSVAGTGAKVWNLTSDVVVVKMPLRRALYFGACLTCSLAKALLFKPRFEGVVFSHPFDAFSNIRPGYAQANFVKQNTHTHIHTKHGATSEWLMFFWICFEHPSSGSLPRFRFLEGMPFAPRE